MRVGDLLNAFVGLYLVPKYVPSGELGALLPLLSFGSILGIPLSIMAVPLMKFLNNFMLAGEYGKVKALLRDVCVGSLILFGGIVAVLWLSLPWFLRRVALENGRLGLMVLLCGVVTAFAPVATSALQGLKQFALISLLSIGAAFSRLVVMLIALPIRGVTGYFAGQAAPSLLTIGVAGVSLWRRICVGVNYTSYRNDIGKGFVSLLLGTGFYIVSITLQSTAETLAIRQALPGDVSASYYIISRFADLAGGLTGALLPFLFPVAAEAHTKGNRTVPILLRSTVINLVFGLLVIVGVLVVGYWVFNYVEAWQKCIGLELETILVCLTSTLRGSVFCFAMFEIACGRLKGIIVIGIIALLEAMMLFICYDCSDLFQLQGLFRASEVFRGLYTLRMILLCSFFFNATQFSLIPIRIWRGSKC